MEGDDEEEEKIGQIEGCRNLDEAVKALRMLFPVLCVAFVAIIGYILS